jgi:hypothetical protein
VRDHFETSNSHETKAQILEPLVDARAARPITDHSFYWKVSAIAKRWDFSEAKTSQVLERYRGRTGFMDFGPQNRKRKRKYAILRIHPSLLKEIEGDLA